ncbi:hypothetical protein ACFRFL_33850 [Streptomyces sp. NPDC056708]|uniref:hypothetical protein n=1 Tax=unclassified Streptomyces TaxID=2593676 RepID=UPI00367CC56E
MQSGGQHRARYAWRAETRWAIVAPSARAVLLATRYRLTFPYLTGAGALDTNSAPLHQGGLSTAVPGLGVVGMEFQRSFSSKTLRGVGRDAGHVLKRMRTAVAG